MPRLLLLLALALVAGPAAHGQTERVRVHLEIVAEGTTPGTVVVAGGRDLGVVEGGRGQVWSVYQLDAHEAGGRVLADAEVVAVGPTTSEVRLTPAAGADPVAVGDDVEVPVDLPLAERGLVFDLGRLGIRFLDQEKDPFEVPALPPDLATADAALDTFATDLRTFGASDWLAQAVGDFPQLTAPLGRGLYAGRTPYDVLRTATPADVAAFFDFIRSFPGKYLGGTWPLNETFATWLVNSAPLGSQTLREQLLALPDAEALAVLEEATAGRSAPTTAPEAWRETAQAWGREGRHDEARRLLGFASRAAAWMDQPGEVAEATFSLGLLEAQQSRYPQANAFYREAAAAAIDAGNAGTAAIAYANVSLNLHTLGRSAEALAAADTARTLAADASGFARGLAEERRARALVALGRADDALAGYDAAEAAYAAASGTNAAERAAGLGRARGDVFESQGRFAEALAAHLAARDAARALADPEGEADALDEAAYAASRLGRPEEALAMWREAERLHVRAGVFSDAGYSLSQVGQTSWQLGRCDDAIEAHRAALAHRRTAGDRAGQAYSWLKLGALYAGLGDPVEADRAFGRALDLYRAIGDRSGQADVALARAENATSTGDVARAEAGYRAAVALTDGLLAEHAEALEALGSVLARQEKTADARATYERALALHRDLDDRAAQSRALRGLGLVARLDGDLADAEALLTDALALAEATGAPAEQTDARLALADLLAQAGRPADARAQADAARALADDSDDRDRQISAALTASWLAQSAGDFSDAVGHAERAYAIATDAGSRLRQIDALNALGALDLDLGAYDRAEARSVQALAIVTGQQASCGASANPWGEAAVRVRQGDLFTRMSRFSDALDAYARADSLYTVLDDADSRATVANNQGNAHFFQGEYDAALASFEAALALLDRRGVVGEFRAILLANIGEVLLARGDAQAAGRWLDDAVALSEALGTKPILTSALTLRGQRAHRLGDPAAARADLERALALAREQGSPEDLLTVAAPLGRVLLEAGETSAAEAVLAEAVALAERTRMDLFAWEPAFALGLAREAQGRPDEALALYQRSIETMERVRGRVVGGEEGQRRFAAAGAKVEVYETAVAALIAAGRVDEAMVLVERSLSEELGRQFGRLDAGGAQATGRRLRSTTEGLERTLAEARAAAEAGAAGAEARAAALEQRLEVAQDEYAAFLRETVRGDARLSALNPRATPVEDFRRERRSLPDDTAVLAYLVGETRLFAFVATNDTVAAVVTDIGREDMTVLVADAVAGMSDPTLGGAGRTDEELPEPSAGADWEAAAEELYDILIDPLLPLIGDRSHLAIAPTGVLHYLPFAALRTTDASGAPRYLVQDAAVAGITSFAIFARSVDPRPVRVRAFGNADETLDFAEAEVLRIQERLPDTEVFVRGEATEARAKAEPEAFTVLHLATHGTLQFDDFEASYLTLASADGDDGRLTLDEVGALDFPYRLVTLSACNTGVGDGASESWPVNPANTFLASGAESVVATLWAVDDLATSELMAGFYGHLQAEDTAEALRRAQLDLIAGGEFAHPFFWAPFVMLGDWE